MKEAFLQYAWEHQKIDHTNLKTTKNNTIKVIDKGIWNKNSGPDFLCAQIKINNQIWAGNVEVHLKSSDWYAHNHEIDSNYKNIILHIVWQHDIDIYNNSNLPIPTLELRKCINKPLLSNYHNLINTSSRILCKNKIGNLNNTLIKDWFKILYQQKLTEKIEVISPLLEQSHNNWEQVLYTMLAKTFGLNVNGDSFFSMAKFTPFSIVCKCQSLLQIESLFFGQLGLLENDHNETYFNTLKAEYYFLKKKFSLTNEGVLPAKFSRLRPPNFPTIRLSQLANLCYSQKSLFSKIMSCQSLKELRNVFDSGVSDFWKTHYNFGKESKETSKKLTEEFIDLLIINTILPIRFLYEKKKTSDNSLLYNIIQSIKKENNSIVQMFEKENVKIVNAMESQACLYLYKKYCSEKKCLNCNIGLNILKSIS